MHKREPWQECPCAFDCLKEIVRRFHPQHVFIISRAGQKKRGQIERWLDENDFFRLTGFLRANLKFCTDVKGEKGKGRPQNLDFGNILF